MISLFRLSNLAILRASAFLVPAQQRSEWLQEWHSELWHIRNQCPPTNFAAERELLDFCFGSWHDALHLRREAAVSQTAHPIPQPTQHLPRQSWVAGSATRTIFFLSLAALWSYGISCVSSGVQAQNQVSAYTLRRNLVTIEGSQNVERPTSTLTYREFIFWQHRHQQLFDGFAFLQSETSSTGLRIIHASDNLFNLIGMPLHPQPGSAILSYDLWQQRFSSDPHIIGRTISIDDHPILVNAIAPAGFRLHNTQADLWLLEPVDAFTPFSSGTILAHITPRYAPALWADGGHFKAPTPDQPTAAFYCHSVDDQLPSSWSVYIFATILAFLALPAITTLPLGDYAFHSHRLSWATRLRRWSFLAAKVILLFPIARFTALDLAYANRTLSPATSEYIQLIATFSITLLGLAWSLTDQRSRCPVCLSHLTHPARVGHFSHSFLAWNATELLCTSGHGLLHVPGLPTSWFNTQRWLQLDSSWQTLFTEPSS